MVEIFHVMRPFIDGEKWDDAREALFKLFYESGSEIVTDADRQICGLPPRGPDGWTLEEIVELERRRHEIMYDTPKTIYTSGRSNV